MSKCEISTPDRAPVYRISTPVNFDSGTSMVIAIKAKVVILGSTRPLSILLRVPRAKPASRHTLSWL